MDGFEKRELIGDKYWDDPDWERVKQLRKEGKNAEANSLVIDIRERYGLE